MAKETMISLYDYLGHAAGSDLGKKVASAAARAGVLCETKYVNNPQYNGKIMMYPQGFLELYFSGGLNEGKQLLHG